MSHRPVQRASNAADGLPARADHWPSVSVVVPTHNRPQLLRTSIQSILDQEYPGTVEVIVVFDRQEPVEPDVTLRERRHLKLLTNDRTPGPAGAYNVGALVATGEYLALCDDDDEWLPNKLILQIASMERHPGSLFGTCGIYLGDDGPASRQPTRIPKRELLRLEELLKAARNEIHSSTFIVRREPMLRQVGLVDEAIPASYGEDYDWLLRAARLAPVVAVREPLVRVRWAYSYFSDRWQTIIEALTYQLDRRPELRQEPANLARIYGRLAFAHAADGDRAAGREWARRCLRISWRQPRAYLAYLVSWGVLKPQTVIRVAHAVGRGV